MGDTFTLWNHDRVTGYTSGSGDLFIDIVNASITDKVYYVIVDFMVQDTTTNGNMKAERRSALIKGGGTAVVNEAVVGSTLLVGSVDGTFSIVTDGASVIRAKFTNTLSAALSMVVYAQIMT